MYSSITASEFALLDDKKEYSVIFGGTFDPIHEGHIADIKFLIKNCNSVFLAPTSQNPWKQAQPNPIEVRIEMIKLVLESENIPFQCSKHYDSLVNIINHPYTFSVDLIDHIRENFSGKLIWAIGEDLIESSKGWKDWDEKGIKFLILPILHGFSGTSIRQGNIPPHPALDLYLKKNRIYS